MRPLDRDQVGRLLHHADHGAVAPRVAADLAGLLLGEVAALGAEADALLDLLECGRERQGLVLRHPEEVEGEPLSRPRPDSGQPRQLRDEVLDRGRKHLSILPVYGRTAPLRRPARSTKTRTAGHADALPLVLLAALWRYLPPGATRRARRRSRCPPISPTRSSRPSPSPTALAFTPDGRMLITTQPGQLRVYEDGALVSTPALDLASSDDICTTSERGLLGVAVDPNFAANGYIYLYYSPRIARRVQEPALAVHDDRQHGRARERADPDRQHPGAVRHPQRGRRPRRQGRQPLRQRRRRRRRLRR